MTLCAVTLAMISLSWPLWLDGDEFPRIPFLKGWPNLPVWGSWGVLALIAGSLTSAAIGWAWRWMIAASLLLITWAVVGDQNRFQPWVTQYLVVGLALATTSRSMAWRLARLYVVSLYFYSGFSKLDASFVHEMGSTFLQVAVTPFGGNSTSWPRSIQTSLVLMMPAWEIAVAVGLLFERTRRWAILGAWLQHLALLFVLGPWGLGHSTIVLVWNLAMMVEDGLLFWTGPADAPRMVSIPRSDRPTMVVFAFVLIWPAGERFGLCDSWPGHALYASHVERSEIFVHEDDVARLPRAIVMRLGPVGIDSYRRLDQTGWSRDVRGTPLYPQSRVANGLAEFLADRFATEHPIRVVHWSRAEVWSRARQKRECVGLRAIQREANQGRINAQPRNGRRIVREP